MGEGLIGRQTVRGKIDVVLESAFAVSFESAVVDRDGFDGAKDRIEDCDKVFRGRLCCEVSDQSRVRGKCYCRHAPELLVYGLVYLGDSPASGRVRPEEDPVSDVVQCAAFRCILRAGTGCPVPARKTWSSLVAELVLILLYRFFRGGRGRIKCLVDGLLTGECGLNLADVAGLD
jgi:hypothetical protein